MILSRLARFLTPKDDAAQSRRPASRRKSRGPQLETLETRQLLAYSGPKLYGIDYSPTWQGWSAKPLTQFEDSDFANGAFKGLWGMAGNQGRNDLQKIQDGGFNVVRLYNWGPSRGSAAGKNDAHDVFLKSAKDHNLKVMVPVSNFFLSNSEWAWNGRTPDANYSYNNAPPAIQKALRQFLDSVTWKDNQGKYHLFPAVQSISVGNEIDLGINQDPGATAKLQRALWWVVNIQNSLANVRKINLPNQFLTIPISNADQSDAWAAGQSTGGNGGTTLNDTNLGEHLPWAPNSFAGLSLKIVNGKGAGQVKTIVSNAETQVTVNSAWSIIPDATSQYQVVNPSPVAWFQIFANGAKQGDRVPVGTVPDGPSGRFKANVTGLSGYSWYNSLFFNSINTFKTGTGLKDLLTQYDTGTPTGPSWSQKWPNQKLSVPLFITELGTSRFNIGQTKQAQTIADQQAQVAENVLKTSTNLMGYTIFEYNDEPNKNGNGQAGSENFFGIYQYNTNQSQFRNGQLLYNLHTGATFRDGGMFDDRIYPVYNLIPVQYSNGVTLPQKLKSIFSQVK